MLEQERLGKCEKRGPRLELGGIEIGDWKLLCGGDGGTMGGPVRKDIALLCRLVPIPWSPKVFYLATDRFHISYRVSTRGWGDWVGHCLWLRPWCERGIVLPILIYV